MPEEEKKKDVGEREIENIVVDTSKTPLPDSRNAALDAVSKLKRPFINEDQNKEIIVSNTSVRHSSTQDHGFVDVRCMGIIDRIIRKAVKIGEIPVDENEQGHTHKIEVYYCPVNIDGSQYSARLVVKQYENRGCVLEDFQLYDLHARQEKTGASYAVRGDKALTPTSAPVFSYKVKDLIHSTQENDIKLLGLDENKLKFSVREDRDYMDAVEKGDEEKAREMVKKAFDEYLKGHSYSRDDVARVFGDMLEKNRDGYDVFGIRFDNRLLVPDEVFPHSHELYQDYMENENGEPMYPEGEGPYSGFYDAGELDGTSTVWVENVEDIAKALGERYEGRYVYLVGGDNRGGGNDPGELLIDNAKVLSVMTIPEMELGRWKDNTTHHEVFTNKS